MTTSDVLAAVRRRWRWSLVGAVCTILAIALVHARPGVYETQVDVMFLAPAGTDANAMISSTDSLVDMAGLVERKLNQGRALPATASPDVPLSGRGVRHGSLVLLPNDGGQWDYHFTRPALVVQAVGTNAREAVRDRDLAVARIRDTLVRLQDRDGVAASDMIRTRVVPPATAVTYSAGDRPAAVAATGALGAAVSLVLLVQLDRRLLRRARVGKGHLRELD